MSEALGTIVIYAPDPVLDGLGSDSDTVSWDSMAALFDSAGIPSLKDAHSMLRFYDGRPFPHEGFQRQGGAMMIRIFGEEWMYAMEGLVEKGKVEVYGSISHEYGHDGYYARNPEGETYFQVVDFEGDDDVDEEAVREEWLAAVPDRVKHAFPSVFDFDG
ncbi:hypothetical protein ACXYTJ_16685 [Gilvimarinus sp. F26214L]|uniref:hypothetical protein n=1 Tax=Gilvimarinus sp. DZF01 TaxID=3461371 RepID=UPI0040466981